jgi:hypothetical protein
LTSVKSLLQREDVRDDFSECIGSSIGEDNPLLIFNFKERLKIWNQISSKQKINKKK